MYVCVYVYIFIYTYIHIYIYTDTDTDTDTDIDIDIDIDTDIYRESIHTYIHACIHTYRQIHDPARELAQGARAYMIQRLHSSIEAKHIVHVQALCRCVWPSVCV